MKNFNLLALVASFAIVLSSCSTNETFIPEEEQAVDLLKTYTVKRDAKGAYSLDFELNEGSEVQKSSQPDSNQFHLFSAGDKSARKVTQNLTIEGEQLKIGFVDANLSKSSQILLSDDNLKMAKNNDDKKLKEYSISSNSDGTYDLDFNVANNVKVDFVYNEEIDTYEIHLEKGKSSVNNFTRTLEKENGKALKFDFVNHTSNTESRGYLELAVRKPKVIIGNGEEIGLF
ncbi:MAG: hypothetical protein AB8B78_05615 [Polaribacter sp.]